MSVRVFDALNAHIPHAITQYGIRPGDLDCLEKYGPQETVLLVGSYARNEATAASDLDLAVLCGRPPAREPGTRGYPSVVGDSVVLKKINGLDLTVEFIRRDVLLTISEVLDALPGSPDSPSLGNLGTLELRTIERVSTGIVLQQAPADVALMKSLDLGKARANKAALAFLLAMGHLRAATAGGSAAGARSLRLRESAQDLLIAEVNACGVLTFDSKHLVGRTQRLAAGSARLLLDHLGAAERESEVMERHIRLVAREFLARADSEEGRSLIKALLAPIMTDLDATLTTAA